jgi:hypothetical protein
MKFIFLLLLLSPQLFSQESESLLRFHLLKKGDYVAWKHTPQDLTATIGVIKSKLDYEFAVKVPGVSNILSIHRNLLIPTNGCLMYRKICVGDFVLIKKWGISSLLEGVVLAADSAEAVVRPIGRKYRKSRPLVVWHSKLTLDKTRKRLTPDQLKSFYDWYLNPGSVYYSLNSFEVGVNFGKGPEVKECRRLAKILSSFKGKNITTKASCSASNPVINLTASVDLSGNGVIHYWNVNSGIRVKLTEDDYKLMEGRREAINSYPFVSQSECTRTAQTLANVFDHWNKDVSAIYFCKEGVLKVKILFYY